MDTMENVGPGRWLLTMRYCLTYASRATSINLGASKCEDAPLLRVLYLFLKAPEIYERFAAVLRVLL